MKINDKINCIIWNLTVSSFNRVYQLYVFTNHVFKSLMTITQESCEPYWTSPGGNTQQNRSCTATYLPSRKLFNLREPAGKVRTNSNAIYTYGPLHMDEQRWDDQLEPTYKSSVWIQDVARKNSRERWTIETSSKRGSGWSGMTWWWWLCKKGLVFNNQQWLICYKTKPN